MSGDTVIAACEAQWPQDKSDCSASVRDVARRLGVTLTGNADSIADQICGPPWTRLRDGVAARAAADDNQFVVAGLKGGDQTIPSEHGHVVVVVSGPLAQAKYPSAYWGRLDSIGAEDETINYAWRAGDRDRVIYAAIPLG